MSHMKFLRDLHNSLFMRSELIKMRNSIQNLLDGFKKELEEAGRTHDDGHTRELNANKETPDDEHTRELNANKDKASNELDILNALIKYVAVLDSDRVDESINAVIGGPGTKSSNVGD